VEVQLLSAAPARTQAALLGRHRNKLAVLRPCQSPAFFMNHPVMAPAQQHKVVHLMIAAIRPVMDVMRVGPGGRAVATREPAPAISDPQRLAL
jgi:hypothetical protein